MLFGGGEAKLIMTGEEILDAGVQVMAHPPGKRNSTHPPAVGRREGAHRDLAGVRACSSSIRRRSACSTRSTRRSTTPTPTRFCDLVRKMSAQTQFLFISHNKITMEMASQLIGVTMPESGVSRVVAVDIEEALRIREAA